ncbi:MAG: hypothetical protein AAFQ98_22545 [Bacteroidota bacterium]
MKKVILYALVGLLMLSGCRDRMTCPEFQSRYILDDEYREAYFALFDQDTLPIYDANETPRRTWYGTVEKKGWLRRKHEIETVRMEKVFAEKEDVDTATFQMDAEDLVPTADSATASVDSTDTAAPVTPDESATPVDIASTNSNDQELEYAIVSAAVDDGKTYNVEQSLYMYYIGQEIVERRQAAYEAWQKAEAARLEEERIKDSTRFARREKFLSFFRKKEVVEEVVEEVYDPFADDEDIPLPGEETEQEEGDSGDGSLPGEEAPEEEEDPDQESGPEEKEEEDPDQDN